MTNNTFKTKENKLKINRTFFTIVLTLILIIFGFFSLNLNKQDIPKAEAWDAWYNADWQYRKKITIDHAKVDANLTDFPVLVKLNDDNFDFSKAQEDGTDVLFTDDSGNLIPFERERHQLEVEPIYNVTEEIFNNSSDCESAIDTYNATSDNFEYSVDYDEKYIEDASGKLRTLGTGNSGYAEVIFEDVDFSSKENLSFYVKADTIRGDFGYPSVNINEDEVWFLEKTDNGDKNYDWYHVLIDVSSYDDVYDLKFRLNSPSGTGVENRMVWFDNFTFLEQVGEEELGRFGEYWLQVDLSSTSDREVYIYYGNSGAEDKASPNQVWDDGYEGVWHKSDETSLTILDSTSNSNNGTKYSANHPIETSGKIGKSQDYNGVVDVIDLDDDLVADDNFTASYWMKTDRDGNYGILNHNSSHNVGRIGHTSPTRISFWDPDKNIDLSESFITNSWEYFTIARDDDLLMIFRNGNPVGNSTYSSTQTWKIIGGKPDSSSWQYYSGGVDEVRFSSVARSAEWISTEYNNQNSPSTFYSLSSVTERETVAPTNPTTFQTYSSSGKTTEYTDGGWSNATTPYFEWSGADDDESGVNGYYLYFGTAADADPEATSGIIEADNSPHYITSTNFTLSQPMAEDTTYYFRIKTKDNAQNVSATATDSFTYLFDSQTPDPPEYITVSPAGCSTSTEFGFSWIVPSDNGDAGLAGYDYKKGISGTVVSIDTNELDTTSYQDSDNVLYLRSRDNAGNVSIWRTAVYCTISSAEVIDGPTVTANPSSLNISWISSKPTTGHVEVYEGNEYLSEYGVNDFSTSHSVDIFGLKADKPYTYRINWIDQNSNSGSSDWFNINTSARPQMQNLKVEILSSTDALISYNTNYQATSYIEYGIDNYNTHLDFEDSATYFSTKLTNLSPGEAYTLRVIAHTDSDNTEFLSGATIQTPPLPHISGLITETITTTATPSLKVTWNTNVDTTSSIFYKQSGGTFKEITSSDKTQDHELTIPNLIDSTTYQLYAYGIDNYGNTTTSDTNTFQTPLDSRPPTISEITIETSNVGLGNQDEAQIVVSWKTDEPATSFVEYGEGISGSEYNFKTTIDPTLTTSHLVIISGLKESTPYHLHVASTDKGDNTSYSTDNTVIPGEVTKSTLTLILNALSNAFGWLGRWF